MKIMKFLEYIKILNSLDPELTEDLKYAEPVSRPGKTVQNDEYYRMVLCSDPIKTALDAKLVIRESLTKECRKLTESHPIVLKLIYKPSEMDYHIENGICIISGNGCIITNGSPVILASKINRSLTDNAVAIYLSPEWRTNSSLERMILNECKDKIVQNADIHSELTSVFSGVHTNSGLTESTTERVIEAEMYIDFVSERIHDKGTASANEYAIMLKNAAKREFDNGFRNLFADCHDVLAEYSAEVRFTGCFAAVECYKAVSADFEKKILKIAKDSAYRITAHSNIIERNTQRDKELIKLEKLVNTLLNKLKEGIETQWQKIKY